MAPVKSHPLGLIEASSVDLSDGPAGYHFTLEGDRTGLKESPSHRWLYFPDLKAGDAILWHSESVYHSAFDLPGQSGDRHSLDIRLYFAEA